MDSTFVVRKGSVAAPTLFHINNTEQDVEETCTKGEAWDS